MKKLNYSNFELIEDIIKSIDFNYRESDCEKLEFLSKFWIETIGNKISQLTKVFQLSDDNVLTVLCADSFVANELYISKEKIIELINKKTSKQGINIKDIRFNYKKWKE